VTATAAGRIAAGAFAVVLAGILAACTGQPGPRSDRTGSGATHAPAFSGVRHPIPTGSALASDPDLYGRVALTGCGATSDGWKATGTMRNPGSSRTTASILVLFTDPQARTIDSATTTVETKAGDTVSWIARRAFSAPPGTRCVIRAVQKG